MNVTTETMPPAVRRIRAYFAPVNRSAQQPTIFDPAQQGLFGLNAPPAPWIDLGWISAFTRRSGTKIEALRAGAPATVQMQSRSEIEATVSFQFSSWGKLPMALASGSQQMNLLATQQGATAAGSGGTAVAAVALESGSTATILQVGTTAAAGFSVGEMVVADVDYTGQTGFVGSGVSGAYVKTALADVDYVRRVSLNVGRVSAIQGGALTLESALIAGVPTTAMKVSGVVGFCDREGSTFFQEWSALFVAEGQQGERTLWHYPRLQAMASVGEAAVAAGALESLRQSAAFRALPVKDPVDGENVVCFRSFVAGS